MSLAHIIFLRFYGWPQSSDMLQQSFDVKIAESIFRVLALNHTVVKRGKHLEAYGLSVLYQSFLGPFSLAMAFYMHSNYTVHFRGKSKLLIFSFIAFKCKENSILFAFMCIFNIIFKYIWHQLKSIQTVNVAKESC